MKKILRTEKIRKANSISNKMYGFNLYPYDVDTGWCFNHPVELEIEIENDKFQSFQGQEALERLNPKLLPFYTCGIRKFRMYKYARFKDYVPYYHPILSPDWRDVIDIFYAADNLKQLKYSRKTRNPLYGNYEYSDCPTVKQQVGDNPVIEHYQGQKEEWVALFA